MNRKLKDYGLRTENPTYIIAEAGINHGGDVDLALKLVQAAAASGADAVKFQTYRTEQRAPMGKPEIFDLLKRCELPFDAFERLKDCAEECGIQFFSTPFDEESVDYLESIGCELYKVASFDLVNRKLLRRVAGTGKPVIMSVGMAAIEEIRVAVQLLQEHTRSIVLLHCISAYPTNENEARLCNIEVLKSSFDCIVGQSDHTADIVVPLCAVAAGAQVIEKHFCLDEQQECVDGPVSIPAREMRRLVLESRRIERILGRPEFGLRDAEKGIDIFRRPSA